MWGAVWASSSNSHRFVCIFQTEIDCRQKKWCDRHTQIELEIEYFSYLFWQCYVGVLQVGFLHSWREVFSVWGLGCLRLETNLSITCLTARPSCTNSTSRTVRSPTSESKTLLTLLLPFFRHHLHHCHAEKCVHIWGLTKPHTQQH